MEIPEGTVASRLSTGRERLKGALAGLGILLAWPDLEAAMGRTGRPSPSPLLVEQVAALLSRTAPGPQVAAAGGLSVYVKAGVATVALLGATGGLWFLGRSREPVAGKGGSTGVDRKAAAFPTRTPETPAEGVSHAGAAQTAILPAGDPEAENPAQEDESNAATHYSRAWRAYTDGKLSLMERFENLDPDLVFEGPSPAETVRRKDLLLQRAEMEAFFQHCAQVFGHLDRAFALDRYESVDPGLAGAPAALLPHVQSLRGLWTLCRFRGRCEEAWGNPVESVRWISTGWRIADHAAADDFVITHLVSVAILGDTTESIGRVLTAADNRGLDRGAIQEALRYGARAFDLPAPLVRESRLARCQYGVFACTARDQILSLIPPERSDLKTVLDEHRILSPERLQQVFDEKYLRPLTRYTDLIEQRDMAALRREFHSITGFSGKWLAPAKEGKGPLMGFGYGGGFLDAFLPLRVDGPDQKTRAADFLAAMERMHEELADECLRLVTPALTRWVEQRGRKLFDRNALFLKTAARLYASEFGSSPGRLSDLARYLPPSAFDDPFVPQALRERREEKTHVAWSVGPDLEDGGGVRDWVGPSWASEPQAGGERVTGTDGPMTSDAGTYPDAYGDLIVRFSLAGK